MNQENSIIEKVNNWIKNSVSLKLIIITILMLMLLIPTSMIKSIVIEREGLKELAILEVSSKWAESQQIDGPILTIPLAYEYQKGDEKLSAVKYYHLLPENLDITGIIEPEKLRRGIYEIVVYKSNLSISGSFDLTRNIDLSDVTEVQFGKSFLTIGISDLRGIEDQITMKWGNKNLKVEPGSKISEILYSGITINIPDLENYMDSKVEFEFKLNLQGSQNMSFTPLGNTTNVQITSNWPSPSFNGNFLPDQREVNDDGFSANWKILQLNRNFPQSWIGGNQASNINKSAFGVNLILPLDDYQKSMRSSKYAIMTITLTFLIFFLVEIINKRKIHPFQYALVGLALCLFYILLLSISEHSTFNFAYIVSAAGVVSMIALYSISIFKMKKLTLLLVSTLSGIYGFLFVTLQLADYALLMGSLGLTLILAATMYLTRKINWYNLNIESR